MRYFVPALAFGALAAAGIAYAQSAPAYSPPSPAEIVAARGAGMAMSGALEGYMKLAIDGGGEAGKATYPANALAHWAKAIPGMFPPGTGPDAVKTEAKAEVWSDRAGFLKAANDYIAATAKLSELAHANDTDGFKAQLAVVGQQCKTCHDSYRQKF